MRNIESAKKQRQILADNLSALIAIKGKSQADIIRDLGLAEATVRSWFNGEKYPRLDKIQLLADYFNVPRSRITEENSELLGRVSNLTKIPILGEIACGDPILAEQNIDGYKEEISDLLPTGELFYLKAKGDSMVPTIPDQSYVLIRKQEEVEDGEIAAVLVNGDTEATLKRIKHQNGLVLLIPDNNKYDPYIITQDNPARIIGKAMKFTVDL